MSDVIKRWATITRGPSTDDGTFGKYVSDSGFSCATGELPWRDNKPNLSCVPLGKYVALWAWSASHNCNLYLLQNVPGRTAVEIHKGNLCGDILQGRASDVQGCCLLGMATAIFTTGSIKVGKPPMSQRGVAGSGETLAAFERDMKDPDTSEQNAFWLTIQ